MKKFITVKLNKETRYYVCENENLADVQEVMNLWDAKSISVKDLEDIDVTANRKIWLATPATLYNNHHVAEHKIILCDDYRK